MFISFFCTSRFFLFSIFFFRFLFYFFRKYFVIFLISSFISCQRKCSISRNLESENFELEYGTSLFWGRLSFWRFNLGTGCAWNRTRILNRAKWAKIWKSRLTPFFRRDQTSVHNLY